MKKCLFSGYYGFQNTGDDAFCVVGSWAANKLWGLKNVTFQANNLPLLPYSAEPALPQNQIFRSQYFLKLIQANLSTDYLVFLGGSTLHSKPRKNDIKLYQKYFAASLGKKIAGIGVSLGPFRTKNDQIWIREFCKSFEYIAFRDNYSYELSLEMELETRLIPSFDVAVLLPKIYQPESNIIQKSEKVLGVSLCHYERYVSGDMSVEVEREEKIFKVLKILGRDENLTIRFLVFNGNKTNGDQELTEWFIKNLRVKARMEIIPYSNNPRLMWSNVASCDVLLGVRLHSGIFAYTAQIPFLLNEYHPKCKHFLDDIRFNADFRQDSLKDPEDIAWVLSRMLTEKKEKPYKLPLIDAQKLAITGFKAAPWSVKKES